MLFINTLRKYRWYLIGRSNIKKRIKKVPATERLKIVLGAGPSVFKGWISTDVPHFNILKKADWEYFLKDHSADNFLIEHVLEHLTEEEVVGVIGFCHKYLKAGGCLRIAVPDGYHPDEAYLKLVAPPNQGHQSIWNIDTIKEILEKRGFGIESIEYYTAKGEFTAKDFDFENGTINRSRTKGFKSPSHPLYSSLIIDAYKN